MEQIRLGAAFLAGMRALASAPRPDGTPHRRRRIERDLEDLARRHARRAIATEAYLVEHSRLVALLDRVDEEPSAPVVDAETATAWLADMRRLWRAVDDATRRDLAAAIYERIVVTGDGIVEVEPTEEAKRHGIMLALPERVILARPRVSESRT